MPLGHRLTGKGPIASNTRIAVERIAPAKLIANRCENRMAPGIKQSMP